MQQLPVDLRAVAVDCMYFEATSRIQCPVYGCVGIITALVQQITDIQYEIAKTKAEIALYSAKQQQMSENKDSQG